MIIDNTTASRIISKLITLTKEGTADWEDLQSFKDVCDLLFIEVFPSSKTNRLFDNLLSEKNPIAKNYSFAYKTDGGIYAIYKTRKSDGVSIINLAVVSSNIKEYALVNSENFLEELTRLLNLIRSGIPTVESAIESLLSI